MLQRRRGEEAAHNHSIAHRNMHTTLVEMAAEDRVTEAEVRALYARMCEVTQLPLAYRPRFTD